MENYIVMRIFYLYNVVLYYTRSLGRSVPLLLAPVEGWGALQALLGAFGPLSLPPPPKKPKNPTYTPLDEWQISGS